MTDPVFDEILRARLPLRPDVLLRWQRRIQELKALAELRQTPTDRKPSQKAQAHA